MNDNLYQYLLLLGDNSMILGHRLSELCGHGPSLETDIALTNMSLDLFGQVRHYFQYAAELLGEDKTEDDVAMLRLPHEYRNVLLVEQPNTNFAHVIGRQFLFDAYHLLLLQHLQHSKDKHISAVAKKSLKEVKYHYRFSSEWVKRLGDGTEVSHEKMQEAIDHLWSYTEELFELSPIEAAMQEAGIGADLALIKKEYYQNVTTILEEATIEVPETKWSKSGGKKGVHTEYMGYILAELQYMQRTYPNMTW
jgi:ring-1,2-phenylacetyl-CoA epoxidase subunit PaaC